MLRCLDPTLDPRWHHPRAAAAAAVVLAAISGASVMGAIEVAHGRRAVERNVGALVAVQRGGEPGRAAMRALDTHPSTQVRAAAAEADSAAVVVALRADSARESERLGRFIEWLYGAVAALVLLGGVSLWLLIRLQRAAAAMARVSRAQLVAATAEHEHRLATLQGLAATTAHEVNNPLTAMMLNLEVLKQQDGLSATAHEAIAANFDGAARIARIVRELRQIASPVASGAVELETVVDSTLRLLEHRLRPRVQVRKALEAGGLVRAEYVGLGQVLSNLLVNAVEAFGERPLAQNHVVVASRSLDAEWVELTVSDDGPGFDAGAFDRLMTPFVTTKPTGTGLGLYVCRRLIEGYDGRFTLLRQAEGARVEIRLRRSAPA